MKRKFFIALWIANIWKLIEIDEILYQIKAILSFDNKYIVYGGKNIFAKQMPWAHKHTHTSTPSSSVYCTWVSHIKSLNAYSCRGYSFVYIHQRRKSKTEPSPVHTHTHIPRIYTHLKTNTLIEQSILMFKQKNVLRSTEIEI